MYSNDSLRYGLDWDKDYLLDMSMQFQFYAPIVALCTIHPIMQYLLIFENRTMKSELRLLYILTHFFSILNELSFSSALRIYPVNPYAALYCDGPLCRAGINKQILMIILSFPVILIYTTFIPLSVNMHQMVLSIDSRLRITKWNQLLLSVGLNLILIANVFGFGYFGRDHDHAEDLVKIPELHWLSARGGTIFLFGPPGDAQYFKWELLCLLISLMIIGPFLIFFTLDAMRNITVTSSKLLSGYTQVMARRMFNMFIVQCLGALIFHFVPLFCLLSFMVIDPTFMPGWTCAFLRISLVTVFNVNSHQFCFFFIIRSPSFRKKVVRKFKNFLLQVSTVDVKDRMITNSITAMPTISIRME